MKTKLLLMLLVAVLSASAGAAEITIVNPGFEFADLGNGGWNWLMDNEGWGYFANDGNLGSWNLSGQDYGGDAPEGDNVGWTEPGDGVDGGFAQVLTEILAADTKYTLIVEVGNHPDYAWNGYKVQLLAGGIQTPQGDGSNYAGPVTGGELLAEDDNSMTPDLNTFGTSIVTYIYNPELHSHLLGLPLQVRLLALAGGGEPDFDDVRLYADFDPMGPSPYDGETVSAGLVELSWTNLLATSGDPNDPGDPNGPVWVDVWFGTDPNEKPGVNFTKIVDAGENTTSVTVSAPIVGTPPTTYYWQVDSYLEGSPTGDPNEGRVYKFYASDLPPSVDAGVDMITWSGEPVQLDATVVDDGHSDLSYAWISDANDGIEFSATDIEDPIVTITKPAGLIIIDNPGFEASELINGGWNYMLDNEGWGYFANGGDLGSWNPMAIDFPNEAPAGENISWTNPGGVGVPGGFAQVLAETLRADTTYTLTVEVGNSPLYSWGGYKVQLLVGGTPQETGDGTDYTGAVTGGNLLAEDDNSLTIPEGTFKTSTVVFDSTGVDPSLLGEPLQIRLLCRGNTSAGDETFFDYVKLYADPPPPVSGPLTVKLTLGVNDEFNLTPVKDSMTIEVYDTPCPAAIGAGLPTDNPGDINADCITDLEDLVLVLETWLTDNSLTEPVPK